MTTLLQERTRTAPSLILTAEESTRKPGQIIARIGRQLCFFERGTPTPRPGEKFEAMITRPIYSRIKEGERAGFWDWDRVLALLIRQPTEKDFLLYHDGFECATSMCTTTAQIYREKQPEGSRWPETEHGTRTWATPGRTHIREVFNVNTRPYTMDFAPGLVANYDKVKPLIPGWAWFADNRGVLRCEGLVDWKDAEYARAVKA